MKTLGIQGVIRGKGVKTTVSDRAQRCPQDLVNRQFKASRPNALWVSDFTYVSTWQGLVALPSSKGSDDVAGPESSSQIVGHQEAHIHAARTRQKVGLRHEKIPKTIPR